MGKYRMYNLVLRQLSPMQKGVQAAHSIIEYANMFHKSKEYIQWSNVDKTIITLDGGTSSEMRECLKALDDLQVHYATFREEDLDDMMTSISFIVEDKVWDRELYPAFEEELEDGSENSENPIWLIEMGGMRNLTFRKFLASKRLSA